MSDLAVEIRRLGAQVACQCIEHPLQLDVARDAGVDWLQGFLFGQPSASCQPIVRPRRSRAAA